MALKDIDEAYAISNDGRVWSRKTSRWLKPAKSSNGYLSVRLHGKTHSVHRLVAQAFCDNDNDKIFVNHIDGNKLNNCSENLEWVTPSENSLHACASGLQVNSDKQRQSAAEQAEKMGIANRKIDIEQARELRMRHANGEKLKPLSGDYGISIAVASNIVRNVSYKEAV